MSRPWSAPSSRSTARPPSRRRTPAAPSASPTSRRARVPGAVALVAPEELRATREANLKDALRFTPGVYVQPRFGAADESQISIRGSGLRNNFHARGINLLVNGMPYRNADGFTDFESLELLTTEAIEVYKGANALRYGGSTMGGAVNLDTKTGYTAAPLAAFGEGGSFGFGKAQLSSGLARGARRAAPENVANRWGRDYDLHHLGVQLRAQLTPSQRLELSPYAQYRDIDHPIFEVISQI